MAQPRGPSEVEMVGLQALRAEEHERDRAGECQHDCQQLWPPLGAQRDWLHRSGPRIGLAGAPASAADRSAACEVSAAIVAARRASRVLGAPPRLYPLYAGAAAHRGPSPAGCRCCFVARP